MILLDLFSGTGGFHKGLSDAGFQFSEVYYSEIDKHAIANYKYNFKYAEHIGSVENILNSGIERPDIITFGSPCQDFSLAGNRKGLAGNKSSLIQQAITAVSHYRPDVFIWENVKGTFSSNARRDFWAIIKAFADIGGYELEWQLVNTSWILPQNRERIYLVGHLATAFRDWRNVFPIREDEELSDFTSKSEQRQSQTENCTTIRCHYGQRADDTYIKTSRLRINHAGRIFKGQDGIVVHDKGLCPTIGAGHGNTPKILVSDKVIQLNPSTESNGIQPYQQNRIYDTKGISPSIDTDSRSPIIQQEEKQNVVRAVINPDRLKAAKQGGRLVKEDGEPSFTLTSQNIQGVFDGSNIRRLTEIECERLQGFPDDWTKYGIYDGAIKEIPKTQRYKMLGNAVTATMVQFIGDRLISNYKKADTIRIPLNNQDSVEYNQAA